MAQRQTAARSHLRLEAGRDLDRQAGRHQGALAGTQPDRLVDVGEQIHAGGAGGLVGRQRQRGSAAARTRLTRDLDG